MKIKETYSFMYDGVTIYVKIDYLHNRISLVEPLDYAKSKFKSKGWVFADRGVEYMSDWRRILSAMDKAVSDAEARLRMEQDAVKAKQEIQMENIITKLHDTTEKTSAKIDRPIPFKTPSGLGSRDWKNAGGLVPLSAHENESAGDCSKISQGSVAGEHPNF